MPRKIQELLKDYMKVGASVDLAGGKGSHRKIRHPDIPGMVILSGKDGDDAKRYQEKDLEQFLKEIKK